VKLTPQDLRSQLDAVATAARPDDAAAPTSHHDRVERRAGQLRRRRRLAGASVVCVVALAAVVGGGVALWPRNDDVSVTAGGATTTSGPSAQADAARILVHRATPVGELTVTLGPAIQPWRFDPSGPTDRWREPTDCYLPRLTIDVGGRTAAVGVPDLAKVPGAGRTLVMPIVLDSDAGRSDSVAVAVVFGAHDGRSYRLASPAGTDSATAAGSIAVVVRPTTFPPSAPNALWWTDFTARVVDARGGARDLALDPAAAENAFFAGDVNNCPNHTGVAPRPTVPAPPDVADASAAAARALDPSTPRDEAFALLGGDRVTEAQLAALHARMSAQAEALGASMLRVVPDQLRPPVFHTTGDGWVSLVLNADGGPAGFSSWARVVRDRGGWRVDRRSVCAAFVGFVLTGAPPSCSDEAATVPAGGIGPRGADAEALEIFGVAARAGAYDVILAAPRPANAGSILAELQDTFNEMAATPRDGHRSHLMRNSDDPAESTRFLSPDDAQVALVVRSDTGEVGHGPWWLEVRRIDGRWHVTGDSLCAMASDLQLRHTCAN
jgi:hypothetical protein